MRIGRKAAAPANDELKSAGLAVGPLGVGAIAVALLVAACGSQATPSVATSPAPGGSASASPSVASADIVIRDANVLTMDDTAPHAQAVAITGDRIVAVGSNDEVAKLAGAGTSVVSLGGLTLTPGFIDAHQHRIGDGPSQLGLEPKQLVDAAISQGWTMIDELYVDQGRLDQLRDLDGSGVLRLRVNAYLPVQENSPEGKLLGDYYAAYKSGQEISPHLRVAGLKVFTDYNNAKILLWKQADLNAFLLARHQEGWHLAIKTVSTKSLAMILKAAAAMKAADPGAVDARTRLEHMLFATADQIAQEKDLGLVPMINFNNPGQLVGQPDVAELIASEPAGSYVPWRDVFAAGLPAAGISGSPSFYADEPSGAPFGSPMHLIYQGVTRVGNLGVKSPASLLNETVTAEQAMRAHTINAARATFQEADLGSIAAGKLADLVVLSADPLAVPAAQINEIDVLMTMVGGKVEWCAPGSQAACPVPRAGGGSGTPAPSGALPGPSGTNVAPTATVTASSELGDRKATNVSDGSDAYWKAAGLAPQWVQLELPGPTDLAAIRLWVAQDPGGPSVHEMWIQRSGTQLELVKTFDGTTNEGDVLVYQPAQPMGGVTLVRVVTTSLDNLFPAWHEIELIAP